MVSSEPFSWKKCFANGAQYLAGFTVCGGAFGGVFGVVAQWALGAFGLAI